MVWTTISGSASHGATNWANLVCLNKKVSVGQGLPLNHGFVISCRTGQIFEFLFSFFFRWNQSVCCRERHHLAICVNRNAIFRIHRHNDQNSGRSFRGSQTATSQNFRHIRLWLLVQVIIWIMALRIMKPFKLQTSTSPQFELSLFRPQFEYQTK